LRSDRSKSIPGIIRESTRAADELLPEFGDVAAPSLDIAGSVSRLGTGTLDLGINALLEPALDTLAALTPLADLFGDSLHVAGEAAEFIYDNLGSETVDAFAGAIQTGVDVVYAFGSALYAIGDAFGVWDRLASIIRSVGDGLGFVYNAASDAYDALAGGVEWVLSKIVDLHNAINDVPGSAEMSAFISAQDIEMPDLSGAPGGSDSGGEESGGGDGFTPSPAASTAPVMGSAIASLPSTTATPGGEFGVGEPEFRVRSFSVARCGDERRHWSHCIRRHNNSQQHHRRRRDAAIERAAEPDDPADASKAQQAAAETIDGRTGVIDRWPSLPLHPSRGVRFRNGSAYALAGRDTALASQARIAEIPGPNCRNQNLKTTI
jgi:hypothetical protein